MSDESTNLPKGGSDNVAPSDDLSNSLSMDDAASLDIDFGTEDEEDQGEPVNASETDPDSETDAPENEGQEAENEEEGEGDKADKPETSITFSDGTKVSLKEVEEGFMRERDYRHKTQELSNSRRSVEALQARLEKASDAIADFLAQSIPPAPAAELMMTDPVAHYQQMQAHNAAIQQVQSLLEQGNVAKEVGKSLGEEANKETVARERGALLERLPHLRDAAKMEKFGKDLGEFGSKMGFTNEELAGLLDHRQIVVMHYAMRGMAAEQAKNVVKEKVANVPPVQAPQRAARQNSTESQRQQQLRERFRKTGSIHDAAKLDW